MSPESSIDVSAKPSCIVLPTQENAKRLSERHKIIDPLRIAIAVYELEQGLPAKLNAIEEELTLKGHFFEPLPWKDCLQRLQSPYWEITEVQIGERFGDCHVRFFDGKTPAVRFVCTNQEGYYPDEWALRAREVEKRIITKPDIACSIEDLTSDGGTLGVKAEEEMMKYIEVHHPEVQLVFGNIACVCGYVTTSGEEMRLTRALVNQRAMDRNNKISSPFRKHPVWVCGEDRVSVGEYSDAQLPPGMSDPASAPESVILQWIALVHDRSDTHNQGVHRSKPYQRQRAISRRRYMTASGAASLGIAGLAIGFTLHSTESEPSVDIVDGKIQQLSLFGKTWERDEQAQPTEDQKLVPLYTYATDGTYAEGCTFTNGDEMCCAHTIGQQCFVHAFRPGEDGEEGAYGWMLFDEGATTSQFYRLEDTVMHRHARSGSTHVAATNIEFLQQALLRLRGTGQSSLLSLDPSNTYPTDAMDQQKRNPVFLSAAQHSVNILQSMQNQMHTFHSPQLHVQDANHLDTELSSDFSGSASSNLMIDSTISLDRADIRDIKHAVMHERLRACFLRGIRSNAPVFLPAQ